MASRDERKAAHARLVDAVDDPEERVRHLALAADGPSEALAAELEQAARIARARGAPASAAELLSHALRLTPELDLDAWARRCAEKIPVLLEAGDWERAWTLGQEANEKLPPGRGRAAVLIEASQRHPGATALCEQALEEAGGDPVLSLRAELGLAVQALYGFDATASLAHIDAATTLAHQLGENPLTAVTAAHRGIIAFLAGTGDPTPDFDEALRIETELGYSVLPTGMSASCYRALWLMFSDQLELAQHALEQLLGQAIAAGDEGSQAQLLTFLGLLAMRAGSPRAREQIESAIRLADLMEFAQGSGEKRAWLSLLLAQRGDFDAAQAIAAEAMAIYETVGDKFTPLVLLSAFALMSLSGDDPAAALEHTDRIRQILPPGYDAPVWVEFEGVEIEALVAAGRAAEAEERIASLERRTRTQGWLRPLLWATRGKSLLLASQGDVAGALKALEPALERDDLATAPLEHARTLFLKGQLERRARQRAAARKTLEQAAAIFEALGASIWAQKAGAELARLEIHRASEGLTDIERRVAELVAIGRTNREIASKLFISRRTAEAIIARVYRKLDVHSRAGLATRMAVDDPDRLQHQRDDR